MPECIPETKQQRTERSIQHNSCNNNQNNNQKTFNNHTKNKNWSRNKKELGVTSLAKNIIEKGERLKLRRDILLRIYHHYPYYATGKKHQK
jgi:hypothetical protein